MTGAERAGPQTAAIVIIGNEVLSAKIADTNGPLLIRRLRERGVPLSGLWVVPDDVDAIVEALLAARRRARWIFTSGGIGPTHDDVTVRAVALALGRRVVRLPEMEAIVRGFFVDRPMPPKALRLAEAPEGASLLHGAHGPYPVLSVGDTFLLPGVPELFALQLDTVLVRLPSAPLVLEQLFLACPESEIADALDAVASEFPDVAIGSYPTIDRSQGWRVKLTIEHGERRRVDAVCEALRLRLPPDAICQPGAQGTG